MINNKKKSDMVSRNTLTSYKNKKQNNVDTIPLRINFIKKLLDNKQLDMLVDFDNLDTENFTGGGNKRITSESDKTINTYDTRNSLNKKLLNFNEVILKIGGKLMYIKSGSTGHTFKGIVDPMDDDKSYAVKVVAYPKKENYGTIYDVRRPENAELMMIKLLSYFVITGQTPHIILPMATFYTNIKTFVELINEDLIDKDNKKYNEFVKKYKDNELYDNVSILISEWATRGDFLDYVKKYYKNFKLIHWKVFFFQIISTLAIIQNKFPSFRHNDLKANNILITKIQKKTGRTSEYTIDDKKYVLPDIGYQLKLWDFDFACIPGIVDNTKVSSDWTKQINVIPEQNRYYDMHYFFNTFIKKGFFPQFMEDKNISQEAKDFVNRIVPPMYQEGKYVHKRGRILIKKEYLLPIDVIKNDSFFEEFRIKKQKNTKYGEQNGGQNREQNREQKNKDSKLCIANLDDLLLDDDSSS
jgi:hypothetical protein